MSPTSLKITLHELNLGANFSFGECLQMEFRLAVHCVEDSDFHEGMLAYEMNVCRYGIFHVSSVFRRSCIAHY